MKVLIWLTILQALAAIAVPHRHRRQTPCTTPLEATTDVAFEVLTKTVATVTVIATVATVIVDVQSSSDIPTGATARTKLDTVPTAQGYTAPLFENSNGVIWISVPPASKSHPHKSYPDTIATTAEVLASTSSSPVAKFATATSVIMASAVPTATSVIITSAVTPNVSVTTVSSSSGNAQILPTMTQTPSTVGSVVTSLTTTGMVTSGPLISTSISSPTSTLSPTAPVTPAGSSVIVGNASENIFQPVATDAPPSVIGNRPDHPVPRLGIQAQNSPFSTNKFYANFFLGDQTAASWTHPYSVAWAKGGGSSGSWGISIQHIDANQRVSGPNQSTNPVEYFINPIGIQSMVLSATELGASTTISMDTLTAFSANVNLLPSPGAAPAITFPLVQGMGFVTGIYNGATPILQSGVFFRSVTQDTTIQKPGVTKYTALLEDGKTWLMYAYSASGQPLEFTVVNNGLVQATSNFNGIIQIAKNPGGAEDEALYDDYCAVYPTTVALSGSATGAVSSYNFAFAKAGMTDTTLLMFALPHHVESFSPATASALTQLQMQTTTKGNATAVIADSWTLTESLPTTMGFAPWSPTLGSGAVPLSAAAIAVISSIATSEVSQNMSEQTNLNSMYYSGKVFPFISNYSLTSCLNNFRPSLNSPKLSTRSTTSSITPP
jgi:endo-1,3(4)-beta-glucanase